jgi:hypothetical protein
MFLPNPIHNHFHKCDGKQKGQFMPNAKPIMIHFEVATNWYQQFQASVEEDGPEPRARGRAQGTGAKAKRSRQSASLSGPESSADEDDEPKLNLTITKKKVMVLKIDSLDFNLFHHTESNICHWSTGVHCSVSICFPSDEATFLCFDKTSLSLRSGQPDRVSHSIHSDRARARASLSLCAIPSEGASLSLHTPSEGICQTCVSSVNTG